MACHWVLADSNTRRPLRIDSLLARLLSPSLIVFSVASRSSSTNCLPPEAPLGPDCVARALSRLPMGPASRGRRSPGCRCRAAAEGDHLGIGNFRCLRYPLLSAEVLNRHHVATILLEKRAQQPATIKGKGESTRARSCQFILETGNRGHLPIRKIDQFYIRHSFFIGNEITASLGHSPIAVSDILKEQ
jgi:hypothetical protein